VYVRPGDYYHHPNTTTTATYQLSFPLPPAAFKEPHQPRELSLLSKAKSGAISVENEVEVLGALQEALKALLLGVGEGKEEGVVGNYKEGQRRIIRKSLKVVGEAL